MASVLMPPMRLAQTAKRVYVPATLLATLIALLGFWPTYFGPVLAGTVDTVPIIHVHAAVYVGWLTLVIAQGVLAATGRTALHVRIGKIGMAYGVLVIVIGLAVAFSGFASRIDAGNVADAQRTLFGPLTDMIFFAAFLGGAWAYRRKPEIHKRLIIVATTTLLIAESECRTGAEHRDCLFSRSPPSCSSGCHRSMSRWPTTFSGEESSTLST